MDTDCRSPLPRCDTAVTAGRCVECLVNADCGGALVCDPVRKTCAECTTTMTAACDADLAGARCLAGGQCGCTADADCGGATSGRICDATVNRCTPGCRGMGGNTCPVSQQCTSTSPDVGRCETPPSPDGGVDGGGSDGPTTDGGPGGAGGSGGGAGGSGGSGATGGNAATGGSTGTGGFTGTGGLTGTGGIGAAGGSGASGGGSGAAGIAGRGGSGAGVAGRGGSGGAVGLDGGDDPDGSGVLVGGYVAGGGCRCDAGDSGGTSALPLLGLLAIAVRRRRRPR
jgi:MYXO-CTERM domain-containing protein